MSVTESNNVYKTVTFTIGELNAIEAAVKRECDEMQRIADCYPPSYNFGRMVRGLLVDLQTALVKVRA